MPTTSETLKSLIAEGEKFTFQNFCSSRSRHGNPASFSTEWIVWCTRAQTFLKQKFGPDSIPYKNFCKGVSTPLLGMGQDQFFSASSLMLGALQGSECSIFDESLKEVGTFEVSPTGEIFSEKVFIVHGHDEVAKNELELFLNNLGLQPVVLHRQADEGQTVIEKFEKHSDVGYVFVLLTPDEISYLAKEEEPDETKRNKEYRARPNVIFEFGFFVGRLGRRRVCCLYTGDVTLPSDLGGFIYKKFRTSIEECGYPIIKELKAAGYDVVL